MLERRAYAVDLWHRLGDAVSGFRRRKKFLRELGLGDSIEDKRWH